MARWLSLVPAAALAWGICGCSEPGSGGGGAGGGAGGSSGTAGAGGGALLACNNTLSGVMVPAAIANPVDFSVNTETGAIDQHTFVVTREDVFNRTTTYTTSGGADHQHPIQLTAEQVDGLLTFTGFTAMTAPPSGAPTGHIHTVTVTPCGIPSN